MLDLFLKFFMNTVLSLNVKRESLTHNVEEILWIYWLMQFANQIQVRLGHLVKILFLTDSISIKWLKL